MNPDAKPAPKRRPWLQVHLSTCVILMFVAGALLWANATERTHTTLWLPGQCQITSQEIALARNSEYFAYIEHTWTEQGWPWNLRTERQVATHQFKWGDEFPRHRYAYPIWDLESIPLDALVALGILAAVAVACEAWIRRRARRKAERPAALT